jgi:hypothetical protein
MPLRNEPAAMIARAVWVRPRQERCSLMAGAARSTRAIETR